MARKKEFLMPPEFPPIFPSCSQLDSLLEQALVETGAPGATMAVLVDGETTLRMGIGELAAHPDAKFYAYSVTKSVLATLALQLADAGRLELDGPILTWLPELQVQTPMTVRQLLNHTSGLPDYGGMSSYRQAVRTSPEAAWGPSRFMALLSDATLLFAPGQGWSYSNLGYMLIRRIIEAAGGVTPDESLASRIALPLGLTETRFASSRADAIDLTPGFEANPDRANIIARYDPGWVSHGVVRSTALELARLLDGVTNGSLLGEVWLEQMLSGVPVPGAVSLGRDPRYGLGLMIETMPFGRVVGHNGEGPGYSVACWSFTATGRRIAGACMINQSIPNGAQTLLFRAFSALMKA